MYTVYRSTRDGTVPQYVLHPKIKQDLVVPVPYVLYSTMIRWQYGAEYIHINAYEIRTAGQVRGIEQIRRASSAWNQNSDRTEQSTIKLLFVVMHNTIYLLQRAKVLSEDHTINSNLEPWLPKFPKPTISGQSRCSIQPHPRYCYQRLQTVRRRWH